MSRQTQFDEAVEKAKGLGHTMISDPPHELSRAWRWSCNKCGRAVLSCNGNVYGSAMEKDCDGGAWQQ